MARQSRDISPTGIYHVMMRGINRQTIFIDDEDKQKFLESLWRAVRYKSNTSGKAAGKYEVYAYALMGNHFHILVRVVEGNLGEMVKKIAAAYVRYFNQKYHRDGHLFKERFKSEICEYADYFETLLRYIHQNPLKAGLCNDLMEYKYTSWPEYEDPDNVEYHICTPSYVLNKMSLGDLKTLVYSMLPPIVPCIDLSKEDGKLTDDDVKQLLLDKFAIVDPKELKDKGKKRRRDVIRALLECGGSNCQINRLTDISKSVISRIQNETSASASDSSAPQ